ncbi:MaoC family dehydratase [Actinophytocola oryzae]|uniref:MaoC dehydratase-like protein n=1 Tax=Actinophytocola oryzae TaxID=502181 RepID=A0A4R7VNE6_9PSEU|nr:MaoC/PaaZ C-terminal domain-containing protein [Actinophytocola oryzae]TDV50747.1 MaoC dehydratase-like protein [Actinophytocola oryzae]
MVELSAPPSLRVLYPKAVLTGFRRKGGELPDTVYTLSGVTTDPTHLAAYDRVCGFRLTDELPATYPHVLTFPLQIKLMSGSDFPFPLVGSVHVANRITTVRPLRIDEKLDLRVRLENLRDHPRGRQFDVVSEAYVDGEVVWTDVSTYLRRGGGSGGGEKSGHAGPPEPTAVWRVPDDTGRRYGEVSGDRNPIHLYRLTARMFGFPRAIAHGMWTKARCLAAFEGRLPDAYTVDVAFKLPVLLPARVGFAAADTDGGRRFDLFDAKSGKPHLTGEIS